MQNELRTLRPGFNVELLGINMENRTAYNFLAVVGRTLPWLQDTNAPNTWTNWNVRYRDVRILDAQGRLYRTYNLTDHNLQDSANFATLKSYLLVAAQVADSDGDGLPDAWEERWMAGLAGGPADDPDGDGRDNRTEMLFGSEPLRADVGPVTVPRVTVTGGVPSLTLTFRRPVGAWGDYRVEASTDLATWGLAQGGTLTTSSPRHLFDGTAVEEASYTWTPAAGATGQGFLRVRAASSVR